MKSNELMKTITFENYNGDVNSDGFIDSSNSAIIDIISLNPYSLFNY